MPKLSLTHDWLNDRIEEAQKKKQQQDRLEASSLPDSPESDPEWPEGHLQDTSPLTRALTTTVLRPSLKILLHLPLTTISTDTSQDQKDPLLLLLR